MRLSFVKWLAILACLLPLTLAKTEVIKGSSINSTSTSVGNGRTIVKKIPCKSDSSSSSSSGGLDLNSLGLGSITSSFNDIIATFTGLLNSLMSSLDLSSSNMDSNTIDLSNLGNLASVGEKVALDKFKKLKIPAILFLSVLVGAIAVGATLLIPLKISKLQGLGSLGGSDFMQNMLDGMTNLLNQAISNFGGSSSSSSSSQYGAPSQGYGGYPQSGGYPQAQQGYGGGYQQDAYPSSAYQTSYQQGQASDTTAYNAAGAAGATAGSAYNTATAGAAAGGNSYNAPTAGANTAYNAPTGSGGASSAYNAPGGSASSAYNAPGGSVSSAYNAPAGSASSAYNAPVGGTASSAYTSPTAGSSSSASVGAAGAQQYNAPSASYTDPSSSYGAPNKRYSHYSTLTSNYLRAAKRSK